MIKSLFEALPPGVSIVLGLLLFIIGLKGLSVGLKATANPEWLQPIDNPYIMFLVAIGVTLVWQSSSLTTALLVPLVATGQVGLAAALGGILGANLGTTITAHLAALFGEGYQGLGRAAAIYHTMVNILMAALLLNPWALRLSVNILR